MIVRTPPGAVGFATTPIFAHDHSPAAARENGYAPLKDALDFGLALLLLIMTAPLIGALAVLVRLSSHGPAIYRQVRLGHGGRPFTIYKIRTMAHDCEC